MASAATKSGDDNHSMGEGGGTRDGGDKEYSQVDNWLGSGTFATQPPVPAPHHTPPVTPKAASPSPNNQQFSLEYRSARALARVVVADPANSHCWASAFGEVA
ncbi:hypothetical protein ZWY2020_039210 [Hordeum vulgare]|nr:hypothetical protein ZWY2020_039210 [Hordeum vulgare]